MWYERLLEKDLLPDFLIRAGIRRLLRARLQEETAGTPEAQKERLQKLILLLKTSPIAVHTDAANQQHYELPSAFFRAVLGPRLKYSGCYWPEGVNGLAAAEEAMLALTCQRARIENGQAILELGCGWGSLSLYIAEKWPACRVTGVSNSRTQKEFIDAEARRRGLANVSIITADMNSFSAGATFDRILSVEMFEHMRNYDRLLEHVASWMRPDALLFVHIFTHARWAYLFEDRGNDDWMARYFFTGGIMPSANLLHDFQRDLRLIDQWTVNGEHYAKTLNAWLDKMDAQRAGLFPLFEHTYGKDSALKWWVYWRTFFMACAELFGFRSGKEWFVSHYLFERR